MSRLVLNGFGADHAPMQVSSQSGGTNNQSVPGVAPATGGGNMFMNLFGGLLTGGASAAGNTFNATVSQLVAADEARQRTSGYAKFALAAGVVVVGGILAWGLTRK